MGPEIERKFLVANEGWRQGIVREEHLQDGLVATTGDRKVRIRRYDDRATITVKIRQGPGTNAEFEYAIPMEDARELLERYCDGNVLAKTRYVVRHGDATWQVDVYEGVLAGIVLAEIELPSLGYPVEIPPWVGSEVTGDPRYRKINMLNERLARG